MSKLASLQENLHGFVTLFIRTRNFSQLVRPSTVCTIDVLKRLREIVRRKCLDGVTTDICTTPTHSYTQYFRNLPSCDLFFPKLKMNQKGYRLDTIEEMKSVIARRLLQPTSRELPKRYISANGGYCEDDKYFFIRSRIFF